jgi:uncharacterized protein (DUF4415 family)
MNAKNTSKTKTVKFTLDAAQAAPLASAQRKRLAVLAATPDKQIDYSDIPARPAATTWTRPGAMLPAENKQQITLRLDSDVLGFFKGTGKRYQSRINLALREYMNAHH